MKSLKFLTIAAMVLMMAGCAKEAQTAEETVEVRFSAAVPQQMITKAGESTVDQVICTVYSNGNEVEGLRKTVQIVDGQDIVYTPRLIKNQTYDILFLAMKDGSYNVGNMENVTRSTSETAAESDYDAFSACVEYTTNGTAPGPVSLKRPLAKINLGVSEADLAEAAKIGLIPSRVEVQVTAYQAYDVLKKVVTGETQKQTFSIPVPADETMKVENKDYKKLSSNYLFVGGENVNLTYTIYGKKADETEVEITSREITNLPVKQNFNTNLVGNLLTEEVSFNIVLEKAFDDEDEHKIIE